MAHRNIQSSSTWRPNWTENDRPKLFCRCDPPSPELKLRNWEHRADPSTETTETHSYTEGSWVLNSEGHWECLPRCPTYDPSECLHRPSTGSHRFWAHLQEDIQIDRHKTRNIHTRNTEKLPESWRVYRVVFLVDLEDPGQAHKCYTQITESPRNQLEDGVLYIEAKSLIPTQICKLGLFVCPMYWSYQKTPSSVSIGFL